MDTFTAQTIGGTPLPQAVPLVTFTAQTIQGDTQGWTRSPAHDPNAATTAAAAAPVAEFSAGPTSSYSPAVTAGQSHGERGVDGSEY